MGRSTPRVGWYSGSGLVASVRMKRRNTALTMMNGQDLVWNRSRLRAFIGAALVAAIFLLANVPGQPIVDVDLVGDGAFGFDCYIQSVVQEWPLSFLLHDGHYPGSYKNGLSAWRVGRNAQLTPTALVANTAILLIGTVAIARTVHRRLQRHHWRIRIVDLIVATFVICVVAAFFPAPTPAPCAS